MMLQAGGPAMGKDFFDWEEEIKEVLGSLEKDNILLISPRRYGKTSLMREVVRRLSDQRAEKIRPGFKKNLYRR